MYMKDRILKVMQKEGLSNAEFAEKIGISTSSLSHIFSGRNKPSLEVVMRIHKACPYININWLLYGEGEMCSRRNRHGLVLTTARESEKHDRRAGSLRFSQGERGSYRGLSAKRDYQRGS